MRKKLKGFFGTMHKDICRIIWQRKQFRRIAKDHQEIRRIIGRSIEDGSPIFEPPGNTSWVIYGGAGSGKSICVAIPAVQSLLWDHSRAIIINDVKSGEIAHQIAQMCIKAGRRFAVIDDTNVMGADYPFRVRVNGFGNLVSAYEKNSRDLLFEIETSANTILPEPEGGVDKNFFFRQVPREIILYATLATLTRDPSLATPGGVTALLTDPQMFRAAVDHDAEDGDELVRDRARQIQEMRDKDPEHYSQHTLAATSALRIFMGGSPLAEAGRDADVAHDELLKGKYIVCIVQNQRSASRLGVNSGLQFNAFLSAQLSGECGRTDLVLDEAANTPAAKEIIEKVTIFRSSQFRVLYIAQSRSDLQRQFGEKLIATLEDNCNLQWLQFGNYEEAERVSKAIGEIDNVNFNLGGSSDKPDFTTTFQTGRERRFTADDLMNLPPDEQFFKVPGVPFTQCNKISMQHIAPTCFDLSANPYEGGRLEPDVKVDLTDYFEVKK